MDRLYILTGFVWLIAGMVFGAWLGATDQLSYANSHAHANLLGFVLSVLFGLLHRGWPDLAAGRMAMPQYWVYQVGAIVLVTGKFSIDGGGSLGVLAPVGSVIVVAGTLAMALMFVAASREPVVAPRRVS